MTNPLVHTLVFVAAVIIPGGLLVYFAWRACKRRQERIAQEAAVNDISDPAAAFRQHFPVQNESLPVRDRREKLNRFRKYRRRNSQN